jgi:fructose-bisphosphate aldolase class II
MPFCPFDVLLQRARAGQYAIGAFNIFGMEFLPGILQAAEEERSPVLLAINPIHFPLSDIREYLVYVKSQIHKAGVPVGLHLDHGKDFDVIMQAVQLGFPSVMFDGSRLRYDENVAQTKEIVRLCKKISVTVEAELGTLNDEGLDLTSETREKLFTDPDVAREFVDVTAIDALAVSIGNAHGVYKGDPQLDFNRLRAIRDKVPVPLVLHGGSGIPDEDFKKAIHLGISKINIYTEMSHTAAKNVKQVLNSSDSPMDYPATLLQARKAVKEVVREKLRVFGSAGKA